MAIWSKIVTAGMMGVTAISMLGTTAMAATIQVDGTAAGYSAYKLMDLETFLKADCGHADGEAHDKDCYLYKYTVSDKYRDGLKAAVADAGLDFDITKDGALSDRELIDGMEGMDAETTRLFADKLWKHISGMDADMTATDKAFADADQGYYLIYESQLGEDPDARSLVILDTAGREDIVVDSKEGVPTIQTHILIEDDTQDDGYRRVNANDVNAGDTVLYETRITMPENIADYESYEFTVHDKVSGIKQAGDVTIYVDGQEAELVPSTPVDNDGCLFHLRVNKDGGLTVGGESVTLTKDSVITLRYEGQLDGYATGKAGNSSEVWMDFSNDPYDAESNGTTPVSRVLTFTYRLKNDKVDSHDQALKGADFELYRQEGEDWVKVNPEQANDGLTATEFGFKGLDAGTYKLVESVVPDGYMKSEDVIFEIRAEYDEDAETPELTGMSVYVDGECVSEGDGSLFAIALDAGEVSTKTVNERGIRLPGTGELGRMFLYMGSAVCIVGGSVVLCMMNKKKRNG